MEELEENRDIIKKAFISIQSSLDIATLEENEKNALKMLTTKLIAYYDKKVEGLTKKGTNINGFNSEKLLVLKSFMTDILVDLTSVINNRLDVYYFASIVSKKLNDKEIEKLIKVKKK